jgi:outer membrane protein assembly factor BamA
MTSRAWVAGVVALAGLATARAEPLSPADLARKNERGYVTGLPLFAYSTDLGFGAGARAYYYWNGERDDPRFATTPYLHRVFLQVFASTRGLQFHWLDYDAPKIAGSPYRLRAQLIFQRNINSNYFGLGSSSLDPLRFPGSPSTYASYADYTAAQQQISGSTTYTKYDQYDLLRPAAVASVERMFADDHVRVLGGFGVTYTRIRDYSGKRVDAIDAGGAATTATMATTRLAEDCAAGKVVGCTGGRDNYLRLGISYDTRDFEPDPNRGVFLDAALDAGTVALGSQFDYLRFLAAARGYWNPIPDKADLILAGRLVFEAQSNGAPFFSMDTLPFTEDPRAGLGGHRTLRGFRQDRFVGSVMTLANAEVRWTWGHATVWSQKLAFMVVPFFDVGRPYDSLGELTLRKWRPSYGGAFRVSWNLATVITVDYGKSAEDTGLYINFNHIF